MLVRRIVLKIFFLILNKPGMKYILTVAISI
jgi:hypothetical protein